MFISYAPRHGQGPAEWIRHELAMVRYAVALSGEVDDWQSALSMSDHVVVLLTSDSARNDSPVASQVRYARKQNKPLTVMRIQPGFTPLVLIRDPYLDAQMNRGAALGALLDELRQKPRISQSWKRPDEVETQLPDIFAGRQELLERFDHHMSRIRRDGRTTHVIYGRSRTGKTTLLRRLKDMAHREHGALVLYADLNPLSGSDENRLPVDWVLSLFWAHLLEQYPPT